MKRLIVLILLFGIVGCNMTKQLGRKREPIVTEIRTETNKPQFSIPQIRKPRVIKANKDKMNVSDQIENIVKPEEANNIPEENENVIDRNKRFDNLVEPNKEIKEMPETSFDKFFTLIGMVGISIVLVSGVYFILRNFF